MRERSNGRAVVTARLACLLVVAVGGAGGCAGRSSQPPAAGTGTGTDGASGGGAATAEYEVRDATPEPLGAWTKLGERALDRESGRETVRARADEGKVGSVRFVVRFGKLEIASVAVTFDDGKTTQIPGPLTFGDGTTSRAIDFPGEPRAIRLVAFEYRGVSRGRTTQLEVWGR